MRVLPPDGGVVVIDLGSDENVLDPAALGALRDAVRRVADDPDVRAVVTTGSGRFFCNGLALGPDGAAPPQEDLRALEDLLATVLELPVPTVAALPGHAFAGGALLALAHDRRVVRADRGYVCLPEVDLGVPLSPGMLALVVGRLGPALADVVVLEGGRYGGVEAAALGIAHEAAEADDVLPRAVARARALAVKDSAAFATMKRELHRATVSALRRTATS
jgi:enoyl-CoA hydratase/carnithine racemase